MRVVKPTSVITEQIAWVHLRSCRDWRMDISYCHTPFQTTSLMTSELEKSQLIHQNSDVISEVEVKASIDRFLNNKGTKSVDHFHKRLGLIMWNKVGMARNEAGLKQAIEEIAALKEEFYNDVFVPGAANEMNPELDKAMRVADFIELGQLMAVDALHRLESCGGHFREEYQDSEGETLRDDENFKYVAAWEYQGGDATKANLNKEALNYEFIKIAARNYK